MEFACRLGGPGPCALRVSVRKEERGGRSYSKLGFAVLDLTGLGRPGATGELPVQQEHSCILSPYSQKQRVDNSTLRLSIKRVASSTAVVLAAPSPASAAAASVAAVPGPCSTGLQPMSASSVRPSSPLTDAVADSATGGVPSSSSEGPAGQHRRNPSSATGGTYSVHSRTNSMDAQQSLMTPQLPAQDSLLHPAAACQSASLLSFDLVPSSLERKRSALPAAREQLSSRIVSTRTDNFQIVREVLELEGIRVTIDS